MSTIAEPAVPLPPPEYAAIPPLVWRALWRYHHEHRPTGDFLQACIRNDLLAAFGRADDGSAAAMNQIVGYIYRELPSRSHGDANAYQAWIRPWQEKMRTLVEDAEKATVPDA